MKQIINNSSKGTWTMPSALLAIVDWPFAFIHGNAKRGSKRKSNFLLDSFLTIDLDPIRTVSNVRDARFDGTLNSDEIWQTWPPVSLILFS